MKKKIILFLFFKIFCKNSNIEILKNKIIEEAEKKLEEIEKQKVWKALNGKM